MYGDLMTKKKNDIYGVYLFGVESINYRKIVLFCVHSFSCPKVA